MTLMIARGGRRPATGAWVTVFSQTLNSNAYATYGQYTFRQIITAALWSPPVAGTKIRIICEAATSSAWTLVEAFIGEQAAAGDAYDFAGAPTRITFTGGSNGFALAASGTITSDEIPFAFDPGKNYVIAFDHSNTVSLGSPRALVVLPGATNYLKVADDAQSVNATGYFVDGSGDLAGINRIEVLG